MKYLKQNMAGAGREKIAFLLIDKIFFTRTHSFIDSFNHFPYVVGKFLSSF
jgi:hypothetical protein